MAEIDCQETCLMKFLFLGTCEPLLSKKEEEKTKTEPTGGRTNITSSLSIGHSQGEEHQELPFNFNIFCLIELLNKKYIDVYLYK